MIISPLLVLVATQLVLSIEIAGPINRLIRSQIEYDGGFTPQTVAVGSLYLILSIFDQARSINISFADNLLNHTLFRNKTYLLTTRNYGLASPIHLRDTSIYLLNDDATLSYALESPIAMIPEWEFLGRVDYKYFGLLPTWSTGRINVTIPDVPEGWYRFKYESAWTVWRDRAKISKISPRFVISGTDHSGMRNSNS